MVRMNYEKKSWNHNMNSGTLSEKELSERWDSIFGKKGKKEESDEVNTKDKKESK